ncbi:MAG TPA: cytochrome c oxidase subunit 3 [Rhodoferax sp.]|jgi:cytochrome c oxidase subunit 3|nr:cytochrome c oxidase subunit 3 [Rhodoferax sp.]HOF50810.1 cytochrome c oxidase subunit 3 [Rhodoferax sp.]HPW83049.1 cytochrome c oxidase subunit 3 [Rhodoferax sp.]HQC84797.1 cytochrome c oxidase subunit 3 [Rhodoferax sp.]HQY76760.1 cytochrome c oxidase subunit 3 [Rhodoferax sp.]
MTPSPTPQSQGHYFVPAVSNYSTFLSAGIFMLALGFIFKLNGVPAGTWSMLFGAALILYVIFGWFGEVISENVSGVYTLWEDRSYRIGMVWFIFSEVMFFACFFGVLYYIRRIALPELGGYEQAYTPYAGFTGAWPSSGPLGETFTPMKAWGIPALNTMLLLTSGATLTWAHWGLIKNKRSQLVWGLALTVILGAVFMGFQAYEYAHAYSELGLTLGAGVYGATFFILTGFHGMHVTLGTIMLIVMWARSLKGHFSEHNHFAFEAVAWYWHFVDVVWLIVFVFIYWI